MDDLTEIFGPVIDSHTRTDATAAGDLVEVPDQLIREFGFAVPVAVTRAVYADCVAWTDEDTDRTGVVQDETGRWRDVLWQARRAILPLMPGLQNKTWFPVYRVARDAKPGQHGDIQATAVDLVATIDTDGITISHHDED